MEKYQSEIFNVITPNIVDNAHFFINDLFNDKFGSDAPEQTNHLISFYKNASGHFLPVSYISFLPYKNTILIGGAITDGNVIRQIPEDQRKIITECGGVLYSMLEFGISHFGDKYDAFFAYTNNQKALEADLAAGFIETEHQYLVAKYHKPLSRWKKKKLLKMIHKLGAF
jgi:hypothetical protein